MSSSILLEDDELNLLKELVEMGLEEQSPTPTNTMKNLAIKLNLSEDTCNWIDRLLTANS
jgi:hypothetical protein